MTVHLSPALEQSYLLYFQPPMRATRSFVFAAATQPAHLAKYLGDADADLRPQGYLRWFDAHAKAMVGGMLLEYRPSEIFHLTHEGTGGHFEYRFLDKGDRTVVGVKFYAPGPQPRGLLDALARQTAWQLAAMTAYVERGERLDPAAWRGSRPAGPAGDRIVRLADLKWEASGYPDDPETMGRYADLTRRLGARQIGVDVHRLAPGERNCRSHAETDEEEAFYILAGRCRVEIEGVVHDLAAGDFVLTFPGDAHFFWNDSDEPCDILAFGGPDLPLDGAVYPRGKDPDWQARTARV